TLGPGRHRRIRYQGNAVVTEALISVLARRVAVATVEGRVSAKDELVRAHCKCADRDQRRFLSRDLTAVGSQAALACTATHHEAQDSDDHYWLVSARPFRSQ